jgi:hypothetical protein
MGDIGDATGDVLVGCGDERTMLHACDRQVKANTIPSSKTVPLSFGKLATNGLWEQH